MTRASAALYGPGVDSRPALLSPAAWLGATSLCLDVVVGPTVGSVLLALVIVALALVPALGLGLLLLPVVLGASVLLARLERRRLSLLLDLQLPDPPAATGPWHRRLRSRLDPMWRELAHHVLGILRGPLLAVPVLAARSPVPVEVDVEPAQDRLDRTAESVAYFCVAEALTNIAKHAGASSARVVVRRPPGLLHVEVYDDGVGGAAPSSGSGLAGLRDRVQAVDGRLCVQSPPGGPTLLRVELPCAS